MISMEELVWSRLNPDQTIGRQSPIAAPPIEGAHQWDLTLAKEHVWYSW